MKEYDTEFVNEIPEIFTDNETTDHRRCDSFYHISEMSRVQGRNNIRYGGEHPWVHVWEGAIQNPSTIDALELSDSADTEERIRFQVRRLMNCFSGGFTPSKTNMRDFSWTVYIENGDYQDGECEIKVVWEPHN